MCSFKVCSFYIFIKLKIVQPKTSVGHVFIYPNKTIWLEVVLVSLVFHNHLLVLARFLSNISTSHYNCIILKFKMSLYGFFYLKPYYLWHWNSFTKHQKNNVDPDCKLDLLKLTRNSYSVGLFFSTNLIYLSTLKQCRTFM